jgi:hypothetical protein
MSNGMKMVIVGGLFALGAAFLLGGRYSTVINENGVGVVDRFTGALYGNGTSLHVHATPQ